MDSSTCGQRAIWLIMAWLLAGAYLWAILQFLVPAHGGVDQNGYLLGGKHLAMQQDMVFCPSHPVTGRPDPFRFVGRMWVAVELGTPDERYYPKYPLGYPALIAAVWRLAPAGREVSWCYAVNPLAMALSLVGTFYLARRIVSGFLSLLAMILLAVSPVTLGLATVPNSHATTLACVVWGMAFLLAWGQQDRSPVQQAMRGLAAGLLLGYAVTIRYTEALLLLPMLLAIGYRIQRDRWTLTGWRSSLLVLIGWSLPVICLLGYNRLAMGTWTGYDPTGESLGFRWSYFQENWTTALEDLSDTGLLYVTPLAVAALAMMFHRRWKLGLLLLAWVVPTLLVYTAYYWAPDGPGLGYPRFFLTVFPALVVAAMWLISQMTQQESLKPPGGLFRRIGRSLLVSFSVGLMVALVSAINLHVGLPLLERETNSRAMLAVSQDAVQRNVPGDALIFSPDASLLHHLQFVGSWPCYESNLFDRKTVMQLTAYDPQEPQPWQAQRRQALYERLRQADQAELNKYQNDLITSTLLAGHPVFFVAPQRQMASLRQRLPKKQFQTQPVVSWVHPLATSDALPAVKSPKVPRRQNHPQRFDRKTSAWELVRVTLASPALSPSTPETDPRLDDMRVTPQPRD